MKNKTRFKIGDKVKIINDSLMGWGVKKNSTGTICEPPFRVNMDYRWIKWNCKTAEGDKIWCAHNENIRLVKKAEKKKK